MKLFTRLILICWLCILSAACVPVAFMAGSTAGGALIYDKRGVATMIEDRDIANEAWKKINNDPELRKQAHISVSSFNRVVLMVGQAPTEQLRNHAYDLVNSIQGIKRIYNRVSIEAPTSKSRQAEDAWITTKVKAKMVAEKGLKSSQIKVVTEDGVVYLLGLVTHKQSDIASTVASQVTGVEQVVKVFEYEQ